MSAIIGDATEDRFRPGRHRRDGTRVPYAFGGDAEDTSRNQLHATLHGGGAAFVQDTQFRQVLLLTDDGSHVVLPGRALEMVRRPAWP
jgi:hypothetical protein